MASTRDRVLLCILLAVLLVWMCGVLFVGTNGNQVADIYHEPSGSPSDSLLQASDASDQGINWSDLWDKIKGYFQDENTRLKAIVVCAAIGLVLLVVIITVFSLIVWSLCCCCTKWLCCCERCPMGQACLCCPCQQSPRDNAPETILCCCCCSGQASNGLLCPLVSPVRDSGSTENLLQEQQPLLPDTNDPSVSSAAESPSVAKKKKGVNTAEAAGEWFVSERDRYRSIEWLPAIGARQLKVWAFLKQDSVPHSLLLSVVRLKTDCRLDISNKKKLRKLNELLAQTSKHPYIHEILEVGYIPPESDGEKGYVAVVQPYRESGSLRDVIFGCRPNLDWHSKYKKQGTPLPREQIALFGRQVIEVAISLYDPSKANPTTQSMVKVLKHAATSKAKATGFPLQSYVQSGNIFLVTAPNGETRCELGGLENALFDYKTRLFKLLREGGIVEHIDVIMFGHVIFEMAAGHELTTTKPTEDDYRGVRDEQTKKILRFVFDTLPSMEQLQSHQYFDVPVEEAQIEVTNGMLKIVDLCETPNTS